MAIVKQYQRRENVWHPLSAKVSFLFQVLRLALYRIQIFYTEPVHKYSKRKDDDFSRKTGANVTG